MRKPGLHYSVYFHWKKIENYRKGTVWVKGEELEYII